MLLLGILLNVNLTSCSKDDIVPDTEQGDNNDGSEDGNDDVNKDEDKIVHPNGIPSDIPNNIIYYITSDNIIVRFQNEDVFGGAKIVSNTYSSTKGYGTIEFASEVTAIEDEAFKGKTTLTYIVWPNSVTSIGESAFEDCDGLASVTIPNSVMIIGGHAFYDCEDLASVTIGNSIDSIGYGAFLRCPSLTSVHISDIAAWCNIEFHNYKSNPLSFAQHLYINGEEVKELVIPNSVTSIGSSAFMCWLGLTSVVIPNSVESIGLHAFDGCTCLASVTIGNSVKSIGECAFYDCSGLTSVTIGNSVESIGEEAFASCINISDVYCHAEKVPSTESDAFEGSYPENATLHVPDASIDSYKATKPWSSFGKIVAITE